jgi:16S rRNA (guanine527-N7)-methyltransferase
MFHVKQEPGHIDVTVLRAALEAAGVETNARQRQQLADHAEMVLRANQSMNLTRIVEPAAVVELHIVDSLAFMQHLSPMSGRVIDIGAGAGYPGVPLAVLGYDVTLCESVLKKAAFLSGCVESLKLDVSVVPQRAEEIALCSKGQHDVVVARAVSSLASLIELASPLLRRGGRLVALKGSPNDAEVCGGEAAATVCGMRLAESAVYALPGGESRSVFAYERVAEPRVKLPRRPGLAQKQPFG